MFVLPILAACSLPWADPEVRDVDTIRAFKLACIAGGGTPDLLGVTCSGNTLDDRKMLACMEGGGTWEDRECNRYFAWQLACLAGGGTVQSRGQIGGLLGANNEAPAGTRDTWYTDVKDDRDLLYGKNRRWATDCVGR